MTLTIISEPPPLKVDQNNVVRVGGTRVTLDTVIMAFNEGATAEEITYQYPSLGLSDVYAVIGYYLRQREEVEAYLEQRQELADKIRHQHEMRFGVQDIRQRLLARQANQAK